MKKANIIVPALLSIAACGGIIAGSTYALFTSEAKVNVAVTSGKVDVTASIDALEAYSPKSIGLDGTITDKANAANNENDKKAFANGGSALLNGNEVTLSKVTPGDKVTFNINVKNNSTVKAWYRIAIGCEKDDGLFAGLDVSFDAGDIVFAQNAPGITSVSKYVSIDPSSADKTIKVSVELPATAGNAYQGKECTITCKVEAVQGNTVVKDQAEGTLQIYTASDLVAYSKLEYAYADTTSVLHSYSTVTLMNDIDMKGIDWTPICISSVRRLNNILYTFDGKGHTISNLNSKEVIEKACNMYTSGFFGQADNATIKDLTISNATIISSHYAGGIVGRLMWVSHVTNCKVINSTIVSTPEDYDGDTKYDNGDKVGGIAGFCESNGASVTDCTVEGCSLTAYRDLGGIVGCAQGNMTVTGNTVKDTTITSDHTYNYKNKNAENASDLNIGKIIGRYESFTGTESNNTENNVTVNNSFGA